MFRKSLFISAHNFGCKSFYDYYKECGISQWQTYAELKEAQDKNLRHMISYAYENVPYYHKLFTSLKLLPKDIKTSEDLEKLPVLTKDIIRQNWDDFMPIGLASMKYENHSSGGTTGTPFRYRLSWNDRFFSGAILYRGWGYGGYELGDRMVFLAGASLGVTPKSIITKKAHEFSRNLKMLSAFDMGDLEMKQYSDTINSFHPKYIRGYPSALHSFSTWIEENDISISPLKAIFTTSEMLYPNVRKKISSVFQTDVYNNYGLNDGGVTAFECDQHSGLHIDMERSVMEVVNPNNQQLTDDEGRILATSLFNYAMPFIRYETGDEAVITTDVCSCGRGLPLLQDIRGRSVDVLITPEGKKVHGWFLLYIFWEYDRGIKEYQVVQNSVDTLEIKLVVTDDFDESQLDVICAVIHEKSAGWHIEFRFVDRIERAGNAKYKYIVNNLQECE